MKPRRALVVVVGALVLTACTPRFDTFILDRLGNRNDGTPGWASAQHYLALQLATFSDSLPADGSYRQVLTGGGVNLIGVIPGRELADEYVLVGAHYDHLGSCEAGIDPADVVCNGATDNAAGVAAAVEIGRRIAADGPPRRSVIVALWDKEEDGLVGSRFYVNNPLVPLADTVAYVNFDIQGANLLPSLRADTFAIGAETGGSVLTSMLADTIAAGPLDTHVLSAIFGQGRSDYQNFIDKQVPTVFFSDATGPCYHTVDDEYEIVDFGKLDEQIDTAHRLTVDLAEADATPSFVPDTPLATYTDAVELHAALTKGMADIGRFTAQQQTTIQNIKANLDAIVAGGEAGFDDGDVTTLLGGALQLVNILTTGQCDGFLEGPAG